MMQGDQYYVPFYLTNQDGTPVTSAGVSVVEMMIGTIRKVWPTDGSYDAENHAFLFPVTQQESFSLLATAQPVQARVYFANGAVVGGKAGPVLIDLSRSREVLAP